MKLLRTQFQESTWDVVRPWCLVDIDVQEELQYPMGVYSYLWNFGG